MTGWTAVLPFKGRAERKTRLDGRLSAAGRQSLSLALFEHVADVLQRCKALGEVALLSDIRPEHWRGRYIVDQGRGLNREVRAAAEILRSPMLVIHADLPFLTMADIEDIISADDSSGAIAPDRHGTGTNALALRDPAGFAFAFGPDSFARHLAAMDGTCRIVRHRGVSFDIDTAADFDDAIAQGFSLETRRPGRRLLHDDRDRP